MGGFPAEHLAITVREDAACAAEDFWVWGNSEHEYRYPTEAGNTIRLWIVDVGDELLVVESELLAGSTPGLDHEIDQIIESIEFE